MSDQRPDLSTPEVRDFWKSVYLAVIRCDDKDHNDALWCADRAVFAMVERATGEPSDMADYTETIRKMVEDALDLRIGDLLRTKDKD